MALFENGSSSCCEMGIAVANLALTSNLQRTWLCSECGVRWSARKRSKGVKEGCAARALLDGRITVFFLLQCSWLCSLQLRNHCRGKRNG